MLQAARSRKVGFIEPVNTCKPRHSKFHRDPRPVRKGCVTSKDAKADLKELNPDHIEYLSERVVGRGSYGECYRARYRGIDVIVKKMTHSNTTEGKERARRSLLHEAKVVSALGDHARLPMVLGIVTQKEPLCLVTQFHGVDDESITLHQAASTNMLTPFVSTELFLEICSALKYVHLAGYLHNDIKANNVVLEKSLTASDKYIPVLIDFGKSSKAGTGSEFLVSTGKKMLHEERKTYLAPEVYKDRLYSAASDVYSLARMLKSISQMVGFYSSVRALVKEATAESPSQRPSLDDFMKRLAAIKFE